MHEKQVRTTALPSDDIDKDGYPEENDAFFNPVHGITLVYYLM